MADTLSPDARSAAMRAVKSSNTTPEIAVRKAAHRLGLRFRLYRTDLPGKPDLVFVSRRTALFVHGCFWHGHDCPRGARMPATNREYWSAKIDRNRTRDKQSTDALLALGWRPVTVWECETRPHDQLPDLLRTRLQLDRDDP